MGLGTDPCGASACGFDNQEPVTLVPATAPEALAFDGTTRNFTLDASGRYSSAHPVDAKVFLICRTTVGSIRSAPGIGQGVGAIAYIDPIRIQAQVEDKLRVALQPVVDAKEAEVEGIDIDTSVRGRIVYRVTYTNLVTKRRTTATN